MSQKIVTVAATIDADVVHKIDAELGHERYISWRGGDVVVTDVFTDKFLFTLNGVQTQLHIAYMFVNDNHRVEAMLVSVSADKLPQQVQQVMPSGASGGWLLFTPTRQYEWRATKLLSEAKQTFGRMHSWDFFLATALKLKGVQRG